MSEKEGKPTWWYSIGELEEFDLGWDDIKTSPDILAKSSSDDEEIVDPLLIRIPKSDHMPKVENNFHHSPEMKLVYKIRSIHRNIINEIQRTYISDPMDYIGTQPDIEVRYNV